MAYETSLLMYTTPSTWVQRGQRRTAEEYPRVIAVRDYLGFLGCNFKTYTEIVATRHGASWNVADTTKEFFRTFMIHEDPEPAVDPRQLEPEIYPVDPAQPMRYTSHTFAAYMLGSNETSVAGAKELADDVATSYSPVPSGLRLPMGGHGIVRHAETGEAARSVIGLGEHNPNCLQIVGDNGNMAVMPYSLMMDEFARHGEYELTAGTPAFKVS